MEASVAKQRDSAMKQWAAIQGQTNVPDPGFFTVPWPNTQKAPATVAMLEIPCDSLPGATLNPIVEAAARKQGIQVDLIQALIHKESAAKPCAVSPKGALGLMQLMPETARSLGVADPLNPEENIDGGTRYLKDLLLRFGGDLTLALGAYNAGPGAVEKYRGLPPYAETQNYVNDILKRLGTPDSP